MANSKRICSVEGCDKPHDSHGYCSGHNYRLKRYGDLFYSPVRTRGYAETWVRANAATTITECLVFPFSANSRGYPILGFNERKSPMSVARYMCIVAHGAPPTPKHEAAHSCGRGDKGCVNPNHLRWATHLENMQDMKKQGSAPCHKLTAEKASEIRRLALFTPKPVLAEMFSVTQRTIDYVLKRQTWAHVA